MSAIQQLDVERSRWLELRERMAKFYFLESDDPSFLDTLEGATSFHEAVAALAREARERELAAEACASRIKEIQARKERHEHAYDFIRQTIARAMEDCGVPRVTAPDVTVSRRDGKPALKVASEDMLPDQFVRIKTIRSPDKDKIAEHVERTGELPAGVVRTNGAPVVTLRFK